MHFPAGTNWKLWHQSGTAPARLGWKRGKLQHRYARTKLKFWKLMQVHYNKPPVQLLSQNLG
ncbi:hypothetical protein AMTR_s00003p00258840 [Amborella trichopoda]|uniref:Uncharacterized protein n=1 Tax=Amborella trichopoda TaxID=13333 RepID=W1P0P1_AMBTC|nr:hypothetical protein AMTR_s00003p00258840 [Amborella trichopoda]